MKQLNLFSVPIFVDKLSFDIDQNINSSLALLYDHIVFENYYISSNTTVLDLEIFADLKTEILKKINYLLHSQLKIAEMHEFYITTSWFVKIPKNGWAQKHIHSNSIFSGVVYLNSPREGGEIVFHKDNRYHNVSYPTLELTYKEWNTCNSEYWKISPKQGDIILFPSNLTHSVEKNLADTERLSLAFNVFAKGEFGVHESRLKI